MSRRASFASDDLGEGFLSDVDATFRNPRVGLYDYQGQAEENVGYLIDLEVEGQEDLLTQFWRIGKPEYCTPLDEDEQPADEGPFVGHVEEDRAFTVPKKGKAGMLVTSLEQQGFPANALREGDMRYLDGLECHIVQQTVTPDGGGEPFRCILISKIYSDLDELLAENGFKGAKGKGKAKSKAAGKTASKKKATKKASKKASKKAAPKPEPGEDEAEEFTDEQYTQAVEILTETMEEDGPLNKKARMSAVLAYDIDEEEVQVLSRIVSDADFLDGHDGEEWNFDAEKSVISPVEED